MSRGFTLLTGSTGFLGSYLLKDALLQGREMAVLARPRGRRSAEERIEAILDRFRREEDAPLPTPTVLEGDLHEPLLGLDEESLHWVRGHCSRLVHSAASLTFHATRGEPYRSNVDGTRYALDLCRAASIREFHLVSTAYVCGRRSGRIMEDELEEGQVFSNDYERSKLLSEMLVRSSDALDRWAVYRPSVIVGDSRTGYTSNAGGLGAFLRVAAIFEGQDRDEILDGLGVGSHEGLNLVPVDWVSATLTHLLESPDPESFTTFHLTNPEASSAGEILEAVRAMAWEPPSTSVDAFRGVMEVYGPYLRNHADFDTSHTRALAPHIPPPAVDRDMLDRLLTFLRDHGLQEVSPASRSARRIQLSLSVLGASQTFLDLSAPDDPNPVEAREAEGAEVRAFCTAAVHERLTRGTMTVEEAAYSGVLVLEGDPSELGHAQALLERWVDGARPDPSLHSNGRPA